MFLFAAPYVEGAARVFSVVLSSRVFSVVTSCIQFSCVSCIWNIHGSVFNKGFRIVHSLQLGDI
jgi:hypothetical protein